MKYLFILLLLTSCSVQNLIRRAERKGYRCDTITDTIRVVKVDSFLVKTTDTMYWEKILTSKDTIIRYKTSYYPKTRIELRYDYKRFNDSLSHLHSMYKDSLRNALKTAKNDIKKTKAERRYSPLNQLKQIFWLLIILMGGIFALIFLRKNVL
mgnify:CR=1 FL=1